jgi:predicted nucleotidyltransferase
MENLSFSGKRFNIAEANLDIHPTKTLLLGFRGSIAHNLYIPNVNEFSTDDIDLMGIYMAPPNHYLGLKKHKECIETFEGAWDVVTYEYLKMVKMLLKSNPNVLSLLWLKDNLYIHKNAWGQVLLDNRDLFSSKLMYDSHVKYAESQLKRMSQPNLYLGYMGTKRKKLVDKFGYDTKMASHAIRLMKMCVEFMDTGVLNVYRTEDVTELIDIKCGEWKLDDVLEYAKDLREKADRLYVTTSLPEKPAFDLIEEITMDCLREYLCDE